MSSFKDKKSRGGSNNSGNAPRKKSGGGVSYSNSASTSSGPHVREYSLPKKIGITIVCALLVIALMLPSLMTLFGNSSDSQQTSDQTETVDSVNAQYQDTVTAIQEQVQADPTNVSYLETLTDEYYQWGTALMNVASDDDGYSQAATQLAYAESTATQCISAGSTSQTVRLERAMSAYFLGDSENAIAYMKEICDSNPDDPTVWTYLGMFYASAGDNDNARSAYQTALSKTSSDNTDLIDYINQQLESLS